MASRLGLKKYATVRDPVRRSFLFRAILIACVVNGLIFIWAHRFLPLSDYPDWLYEGMITTRLLSSRAAPHYAFKSYPVPYSGLVLLLAIFNFVFSPEVSGKLALSLIIVLFPLASVYLCKAISSDEQNPALYIPLLLTFNSFFFSGELFYLLGLVVLFLYCGFCFRRADRLDSISPWLVLVTSIVLFFCHLIPYLIALLVTAVLVGFRWQKRVFVKFAASFSPSAVMTLWYTLRRLSSPDGVQGWRPWTLHTLAGRIIGAFSPFPTFLPWLGILNKGMSIIAIINLLICLCLTAVPLVTTFMWFRGRRQQSEVFACGLICGVAVFCGGLSFGGMTSPGERFLYPMLWFMLCWLGTWLATLRPRIVGKVATCALILMISAQTLYLQVAVGRVSRELYATYMRLRDAGSRDEFCKLYEPLVAKSWGEGKRKGLDRLLTNHAVVHRLPYYLYIEQGKSAPIFRIGVLDYDGPGDNENLCR